MRLHRKRVQSRKGRLSLFLHRNRQKGTRMDRGVARRLRLDGIRGNPRLLVQRTEHRRCRQHRPRHDPAPADLHPPASSGSDDRTRPPQPSATVDRTTDPPVTSDPGRSQPSGKNVGGILTAVLAAAALAVAVLMLAKRSSARTGKRKKLISDALDGKGDGKAPVSAHLPDARCLRDLPRKERAAVGI